MRNRQEYDFSQTSSFFLRRSVFFPFLWIYFSFAFFQLFWKNLWYVNSLRSSDKGFLEDLVPSTRNLKENLSNPAALKVSMFLITSKCFYWKFKLKELQNYNCKVFLCPPQNYAETQPKLSTAVFQNKLTLCHIKLNVYILKTTFTSCKQYLFRFIRSQMTTKLRLRKAMIWRKT